MTLSQSATPAAPKKQGALTLAALGIVYGDIGTSPLYAFKGAFSDTHGMEPTPANIMATLSFLFWGISLIISMKYVWLALRFDNRGEGGVLALQALAQRHSRDTLPRWSKFAGVAGIFAAALFYGDAMITPAISVLSAMEGVSIITARLDHLIIPVTLGILISLFMIQRYGTAKIGKLFGPIMLLWFLTLGFLGVISISQSPQVLQALNPAYALQFAGHSPAAAFLLLSAVFLALTGGEALYADMGHFGARPIRIAWYGLVWPALLLNYFGQGALVLRDSSAAQNPFYLLAPHEYLVPLVILATMATVIASQATITGAYSLTQQAIRLGYLPIMRIRHTSDSEHGQIYISNINTLLLIGVILLVLGFGSSEALAAAYGVAVSGTMVITSLLILLVAIARPNQRLRWLIVGCILLAGLLEILFLSANLGKIAQGGWVPVLLGILFFTLLTTWKRGMHLIAGQRRKLNMSLRKFIAKPYPDVLRVPGTAIYLTSQPGHVPSRLFYNIRHYHVIHQQLVFLHVDDTDLPYIADKDRLTVKQPSPGIYTLTVRFGFREEPDLSSILRELNTSLLPLTAGNTTFFVARTTLSKGAGLLPRWRYALFAWMMQQATSPATYFKLPAEDVVEIGTRIKL